MTGQVPGQPPITALERGVRVVDSDGERFGTVTAHEHPMSET